MQHFHPPRAVGATSPKLISQDEPSPLRKRVAKGTSLHRSRSRIAIEFELKLAAPPEDLEKVERALLAMPIMRSERQTNVVSTYYDTPALILNREGLTLRVRKQGQSFVQTVKANDLIGKNVWERREWEEPITSSRPDLNAPKTRAHLPQAIREKELRSIFTIAVTRKVIEIEPHPSTRIEVAIDKGEIRTADGGAVEPISEIELELKDGYPAPLYDLALRLLEFAEIRLEMSSKAERGYRLAGTATLPRAVQAEPVTLDPAMAVEAALRSFAQACLNHLLNNEKAALAGEPEAIHQMRVAVPHLRSAFRNEIDASGRGLPLGIGGTEVDCAFFCSGAQLGHIRCRSAAPGPRCIAGPSRLGPARWRSGAMPPSGLRQRQTRDPLQTTHRIDAATFAVVCGSWMA
jgi:uncharacterized protein YjbK